MTYYCEECEMVIRDEDVEEESYYIGEAWGRPIYDNMLVCPKCGEPVGEYYGSPETDKCYGNPFTGFAESFGRRDEDD